MLVDLTERNTQDRLRSFFGVDTLLHRQHERNAHQPPACTTAERTSKPMSVFRCHGSFYFVLPLTLTTLALRDSALPCFFVKPQRASLGLRRNAPDQAADRRCQTAHQWRFVDVNDDVDESTHGNARASLISEQRRQSDANNSNSERLCPSLVI